MHRNTLLKALELLLRASQELQVCLEQMLAEEGS